MIIEYHCPLSAIEYRMTTFSRYFKVKLSGEITKCDKYDTKVAATEITILEEINIDEIIKITEWWKNENILDLLYYQEDFVIVQRCDGLWNFIDRQGKILSDEWFIYVDMFNGGLVKVKRTNGELCNINKTGKIIKN